jgi:ribosomal protein S18 acetylase RimI-like enzyme
MIRVVLSETKNHDKLVKFFIKNELEISEKDLESAKNEPVSTDRLKCWQITYGENKQLIAGLVLAKREGEFIIDGVAVDKKYRKMKLGSALLNKAMKEVKVRGGKQIFLVARAPEFFKTMGFVTVPRESAPTFFECFTCPQYGTGCLPEVMQLKLR